MNLRPCSGSLFDLFGLIEEASWIREDVRQLSERVVLHAKMAWRGRSASLLFFVLPSFFWASWYWVCGRGIGGVGDRGEGEGEGYRGEVGVAVAWSGENTSEREKICKTQRYRDEDYGGEKKREGEKKVDSECR